MTNLFIVFAVARVVAWLLMYRVFKNSEGGV
jgi:hypothetical protein